MIYTALYGVMLLMRAASNKRASGRGWALEIEIFWALLIGIEPI
jgi:hypothetical protein